MLTRIWRVFRICVAMILTCFACCVGVQLNHEQVAFQRRYISYIKRCDELERKLRYIKGEMDKFGLNTEVQSTANDVEHKT
jgi:hypothetical protein